MKKNKIIFDVTKKMLDQIDQTVFRHGFVSRAEFFRFLFSSFRLNHSSEQQTELIDDEKEKLEEYIGFGVPQKAIEEFKKDVGLN